MHLNQIISMNRVYKKTKILKKQKQTFQRDQITPKQCFNSHSAPKLTRLLTKEQKVKALSLLLISWRQTSQFQGKLLILVMMRRMRILSFRKLKNRWTWELQRLKWHMEAKIQNIKELMQQLWLKILINSKKR